MGAAGAGLLLCEHGRAYGVCCDVESALAAARAETERLLRRVARLEARLARVLRRGLYYRARYGWRLVGTQLRRLLSARTGVWSAKPRRSGGGR
jgi:hypothetical protein